MSNFHLNCRNTRIDVEDLVFLDTYTIEQCKKRSMDSTNLSNDSYDRYVIFNKIVPSGKLLVNLKALSKILILKQKISQ